MNASGSQIAHGTEDVAMANAVMDVLQDMSVGGMNNDEPSRPLKDREYVRDMAVKVHIRRPGRDAWTYLGRATVTQEYGGQGHSSRVAIRSTSSGKIITIFSELSDLQAERRGNFVVVSCIENIGVVSWSLNTLNNNETLRLLATIELACYKCRQAVIDPRAHSKTRRRIERAIKDDRRKRHKRRKDDERLVDALSKTQID